MLYRHDQQGNIIIVDAKAHGLGYLYPPKDPIEDDPSSDWIFEVWRWILQSEGVAVPKPTPEFFSLPAMMRVSVSTPAVLGMLRGITKPFNFIFVPLLFRGRYPAGGSSANFSLIMPFSKHREEWLRTKAVDVYSGKDYSIGLLNPRGRTNTIAVKSYGNVIGAYKDHPEAKFEDRDGNPCDTTTTGVLGRSHIIANRHRYVGKETSRRWEQGEDMSIVDFRCAEYTDGKVVADEETRKQIREIGIRKVARATGMNRETIALIAQEKRVKPVTLARVLRFLNAPGFPRIA